LPDLSSMQVVGNVYDTEYGALAIDTRCVISLDAVPNFQVGGQIVSLTSVASRKGFFSQKKVFQAVIQPDRIDSSALKPGMTARIRIPLVLAKDTPTIPRDYLGYDSQGRNYVMKGADAKTASVQFVNIGEIGDRLVQIVSGVSVGDPLLPIQR
jgi:HlyD family secretion protein